MIAQIAKVKLDFQALLGEPVSLADLAVLTMPARRRTRPGGSSSR